MMQYFGVYYIIICLVGIACAIIVPRIPPLSMKKRYIYGRGKAMPETIPEGYKGSYDYGMSLALDKAAEFKRHRTILAKWYEKNAVVCGLECCLMLWQ